MTMHMGELSHFVHFCKGSYSSSELGCWKLGLRTIVHGYTGNGIDNVFASDCVKLLTSTAAKLQVLNFNDNMYFFDTFIDHIRPSGAHYKLPRELKKEQNISVLNDIFYWKVCEKLMSLISQAQVYDSENNLLLVMLDDQNAKRYLPLNESVRLFSEKYKQANFIEDA